MVVSLRADTDEVRVHFLNVGQGDAVLIETNNAGQVLIDAGRGIKVLDELDNILPMHDREIEVVVMTHPDADHVGGFIPVFRQYDTNTIIRSFVESKTSVWKKVKEEIQKELKDGAKEHVITRAYSFSLNGAKFDILWPLNEEVKETNAASVILLMTYGDNKVLLTGDANMAVEDKMVSIFGGLIEDVDILKAGHHGSKTSTSALFLNHTKPNAIVYSASEHNRYGHPHDIVRERVLVYSEHHPEQQLQEYETKDGAISFCLNRTIFKECDA